MLHIRIKSWEKIDKQARDDIDYLFELVKLRDDEITRKLLWEIDEARYNDSISIIDRFGMQLSLLDISTGCKAALLVAYNPDIEYDLTLCGWNARDAIIKNIKNGRILLLDEGITISYDEDTEEIDVEMNGYRFTTVPRLNDYIHDEWPLEPDLDTDGVKRIDIEDNKFKGR